MGYDLYDIDVLHSNRTPIDREVSLEVSMYVRVNISVLDHILTHRCRSYIDEETYKVIDIQ
jgi:hypothetical protein